MIDVTTLLKKYGYMDVSLALAQLRAHGWVLLSWGIQNPTNLENKCLRFRVSGLKLKGYVFIFLNGKDYYDIYLTDLEGTVKHEIFDVDCEQLFDVLDEKIEK